MGKCGGQTHTILGSRSQRGLTQLSLDVIFRSIGQNLVNCDSNPALEHSIAASDPSEGNIFAASTFLDSVYADTAAPFRASSRAPTPMLVGPSFSSPFRPPQEGYSRSAKNTSYQSVRIVNREDSAPPPTPPSTPRVVGGKANKAGCGNAFARSIAHTGQTPHSRPQWAKKQPPPKNFMAPTASMRFKTGTKSTLHSQSEAAGPTQTPSRRLHRPSTFPQQPDVSALSVSCDPSSEYAVVISMYEVYNDRIFDLLTPPIKSAATKEYRRRPLLFKPTEASPDRKVVAGLRKVICGNLHQALMVLEAGLHERRVAGTGSNSVSSRSHGFFCVEVKKRNKARRQGEETPWSGSTLSVVDLAGSERARDAKTAGATLAEAGKINESLMYLGQCLQMQSDATNKDKVRDSITFRTAKNGLLTAHELAQPGPLPAVQADRTALLQLLPIRFGIFVGKAPQPPESSHDRYSRSSRRLQRNIPDSPLQCACQGDHSSAGTKHNANHPHCSRIYGRGPCFTDRL